MFYVLIYLAAIVAANLLVTAFGPTISVLTAFAFIGLDLTARDELHERWHGKALWPKMLALIIAGSALSALINWQAWRIALASCAAFAFSGAADALAYHVLRPRGWLVKANGSNTVSSAIDSLAFPALAFGWPLLWPVMLGQFAAKMVGGFLWSLVLRR